MCFETSTSVDTILNTGGFIRAGEYLPHCCECDIESTFRILYGTSQFAGVVGDVDLTIGEITCRKNYVDLDPELFAVQINPCLILRESNGPIKRGVAAELSECSCQSCAVCVYVEARMLMRTDKGEEVAQFRKLVQSYERSTANCFPIGVGHSSYRRRTGRR